MKCYCFRKQGEKRRGERKRDPLLQTPSLSLRSWASHFSGSQFPHPYRKGYEEEKNRESYLPVSELHVCQYDSKQRMCRIRLRFSERADLKKLLVRLTEPVYPSYRAPFCPAPPLVLLSGLGLHSARHQSPQSSYELRGWGTQLGCKSGRGQHP